MFDFLHELVGEPGVDDMSQADRCDELDGSVRTAAVAERDDDDFFWQSLMAAAAIVAIPVALLYTFFLDRFVAGFTLGAVKG